MAILIESSKVVAFAKSDGSNLLSIYLIFSLVLLLITAASPKEVN
jgi:hypothetical protein